MHTPFRTEHPPVDTCRCALQVAGIAASEAIAARPGAVRGPGVDATCGKTLRDLLRWRGQRLFKQTPTAADYDFPLGANDPDFLRANRSKPTITWIGQSTLLLQLAGLNLLTDPHFSKRASPFTCCGPQRVVPPGLALDDLPPIDLVLISHNHYDHLDRATIRRLLQRPEGARIRFVVPAGLGKTLQCWGARQITQLDWWQDLSVGPAVVSAVPVAHWSRRGLFDNCKTGWAGFVIEAGGLRCFFAGDSAYSEAFSQIRRRCGLIDLAALPIGAYEPRWFMKDHHMNPAEAVQAHLDLDATLSLALHWGTFILTDEPLDQPPQRLQQELRQRSLPSGAFRVLRHGETLSLDRLTDQAMQQEKS